MQHVSQMIFFKEIFQKNLHSFLPCVITPLLYDPSQHHLMNSNIRWMKYIESLFSPQIKKAVGYVCSFNCFNTGCTVYFLSGSHSWQSTFLAYACLGSLKLKILCFYTCLMSSECVSRRMSELLYRNNRNFMSNISFKFFQRV
jgi:hypothetical protein